MRHTIALAITSSAVVGALFAAGIASAQTNTPTHAWSAGSGTHMTTGRMPGVAGTVASISGDTLEVTSQGFGRAASSTTPTTYTVDATNAVVLKDGATSTVSAIDQGDMVMVMGTVSGTTVTATRIMDGMMGGMQGKPGTGAFGGHASSTPAFQGNGEPVVGGTISSISGSSLVITNKSNQTYTVDASSATVIKGNATSSLANVSVGDDVIVQGSVNGSSVTATTVLDQGAPKMADASQAPGMGGVIGKIIGGIGGLFHSLFGFF